MSQSLSGFQSGVSYTVSFKAAQRGNYSVGGQDFDVYLDSTFLASFHPTGSSYLTYSTPAFTTTTGSHTLKFQGLDFSGQGDTAFIDAVTVTGTTPVSDTGTVTITISGTPYTYNYGAGDTAQVARLPGTIPPTTVTNAAVASAANTAAGTRDGAGSCASLMYIKTAILI